MSARIAVATMAVALSACSLVQPGPAAEPASRAYPGATRDQVLQAATEVFLHADPAFALTRSAGGMEASRPWLDTAFDSGAPGFQQWQLRVQETDGGVRAWLEIDTQLARSTPRREGLGWHTDPPDVRDELPEVVEGSAAYELFFSRLDQRLGRRPDWITCDEAAMLVGEGTLQGSIAPLCRRFGADLDAVPAGARIVCPPHRPHAVAGERRDRPSCRQKPRTAT